MSTDSEIVDWLEKNSHRLLMMRGKMGVMKFRWGLRDDTGQYHWQEGHATLREAVAAAIAHDNNKKEQHEQRREPRSNRAPSDLRV